MESTGHIILLDDDAAIQHAVRLLLERKGYRVTVFSNGSPLLDGAFEPAQLFILDKQLPGVDGLDICRHLKGQEATRDVPVLVLSASPQIGALAKAACADAFLEKPFRMQILRDEVSRLIGPPDLPG